jgi:Tol biopolymer transport system component
LIISRFCIVPDSEKVVFSMPRREIRQGTEAELVGASIMVALGPAQQTSLTDGRDFAVDPFVTADAKWIYFSSDRLRTRSIWRMPASGSGGLTRITGFTIDSIDSEPALSPDRENPRLAYTSRLIGSPSTSPSYIWLASADGKLPTQLKPGRSPAWSPDGKKLAYVSPEQKIWTMTADGSEETILTKDESHYSYPVWVPPDGKYIVYASDQAPLTELGVNNMDIWIMGSDGTNPRQLTTNGSLDSAPAVSSDGKFLYFFSNRGAAKAGEESLQIFRMELKVD